MHNSTIIIIMGATISAFRKQFLDTSGLSRRATAPQRLPEWRGMDAVYFPRTGCSEVEVHPHFFPGMEAVAEVFEEALVQGQRAADGSPLDAVAISARIPMPSAWPLGSKVVNAFLEGDHMFVKVAVPTSRAGDAFYPAGKCVRSSVCVLAYRVSPADPANVQVLAVRRVRARDEAGGRSSLDLVSGGVDTGETQFEAMLRLVEEKTGLARELADTSEVRLLHLSESYDVAAKHTDVQTTFAVRYKCWADGNIRSEAAVWLPAAHACEELGPAVKRFAQAAEKGSWGNAIACKVKTDLSGRMLLRPRGAASSHRSSSSSTKAP